MNRQQGILALRQPDSFKLWLGSVQSITLFLTAHVWGHCKGGASCTFVEDVHLLGVRRKLGRLSAGPEPGGGVSLSEDSLTVTLLIPMIMLPGYCDFRAVYIQQTASSLLQRFWVYEQFHSNAECLVKAFWTLVSSCFNTISHEKQYKDWPPWFKGFIRWINKFLVYLIN